MPLMLAHGFEPIGVKAESGFPEEDIKHLRDPMLYRNEGKGVWEGVNSYLFLNGRVGAAKAKEVCCRRRVILRKVDVVGNRKALDGALRDLRNTDVVVYGSVGLHFKEAGFDPTLVDRVQSTSMARSSRRHALVKGVCR